MSRLPTLTTPSRPLTGSPAGAGTGIPTPSIRRPRSSLGPGASPAVKTERDPEMDQALKDVLRNRPPSSLSRIKDRDDPETPTSSGPVSPYLAPGSERGLPTPRTPAFRPKTPSSSNAVTPNTSRPTSRPSLAAPRASLIASTTTPAGRRPSVASTSTSTSTPYRPESRAGAASEKWVPAVGDRVRLPSHGYEGTLRYLGTTHIRDGIWAGVELEGAFKGRGRNDGTVDGHEYFRCAPNCGIFTLVDKLAPPTSAHAGPSRPSSVASHRSLTSSYSASGRATPSTDRLRRGATTPSFGTRSVKSKDDEITTPSRVLGNSTATNAARAEARITAGSRASKYLNMTAKQLNERGTDTTPTSTPVKSLIGSTTTTPKAIKTLATPSLTSSTSRVARPSLGGLATPKARGTQRMASASEMMPPPPSPNPKLAAAASQANTAALAALEDEIRELKQRNADLEEQVAAAEQAQIERDGRDGDASARVEELEKGLAQAQKEAEELRAQLSASNGDMSTARARADELQASGGKLQAELDAKNAEIADLKKQMELAAERASGELEAGMEAKREEVRKVEERAEAAELEAAEMKRLVDELTLAGNQIIELNESKQFNFECQIRELEEKLAKANEELKDAKAGQQANGSAKRDVTAVEIDNETLTEQVKHLQNRIAKLEEQLDDARVAAEADSDAWQAKYDKAREAEKAVQEDLARAREDIKAREADIEGHKARIAELQGAVKENQNMLEAARADIETMRAEATAASKLANATNAHETTIAELQTKLKEATEKSTEMEGKMTGLQEEINTLRAKAAENSPQLSTDGFDSPAGRRNRASNGSIEDAEKSILGYHHIVNEMKAELAQLRARNADLMDEIGMLKEENKLLQDINESDGATPDAQELAKLRTKVAQQAEALKEYEREVSELESLIESKIYHEDELESRVQELERERDRWRAKANNAAPTSTNSAPSHSRTTSLVSNGSASSEVRCELCEGPHDLDACPVFAGTTLDVDPPVGAGGADQPSPLANKAKTKKWCNDCESSAHDTAECPMADDVF